MRVRGCPQPQRCCQVTSSDMEKYRQGSLGYDTRNDTKTPGRRPYGTMRPFSTSPHSAPGVREFSAI